MKIKYHKLYLYIVLLFLFLTGCSLDNKSSQQNNVTSISKENSGLSNNLNPEILNRLLVQRGSDQILADLKNTSSNNLNSYGIVKDIEAIKWISVRGGAGIEANGEIKSIEDLPVVKSSEDALIQDFSGSRDDADRQIGKSENEYTWIRLIYEPYNPAQGENSTPHKDLIIYLDHENPDNSYLGIQNPKDEAQWTVTLLADYGLWLEKEIDMLIRLVSGF